MKNIVLGGCSSIALYKTLELVSLLKKNGYNVHPVLTPNASKLISPLLFSSLSGNEVFTGESIENRQRMKHIDLAKEAHLIVVAPATANFLGKIANGIADDLLTTLILAATSPVLIAPAMNPEMWNKPQVRKNIAALKELGYIIIEPQEGVVACGDHGVGKLASVNSIFTTIQSHLSENLPIPSCLKDKRVIVTGGGSIEAIDPVRSIVNRSSGKMAVALINALIKKEAKVTFVYGRIDVPPPSDSKNIPFTSTLSLKEILENEIENTDILIMAAAPGDYRALNIKEQKIKTKQNISLELIPNPDILSSLPPSKNRVVVAFAAETENLIDNAKEKLIKKNASLIVANDVSGISHSDRFGIGEDHTRFAVISKEKIISELQTLTKKAAADVIIDSLESFLNNPLS